jgi:hypothetical protein
MGTWQGSNRYPSIDEFNGFYNIPDQYDNIGLVLRSDDDLPEFGFPELWKVYSAAVKWFAKAFPLPQPQPAFVPVHEEIFLPVCESDDRHLLIEHVDYDRLTVRLLLRMQEEFLGRFPLWRFQLQGWDAESNILVYPTAIRFGNQPVETDPEEALRTLVPHGRALRDAWLRPQRALVAFLRQQLPGAVRAIGDRPFLIVGVLDNFAGNYSRLTICLLMRGADRSAVDMEGPAGSDDEFLSTADTYYVNAEGTLVCDSPEEPAFCVRLWLPPADYRGPLTLIEAATGRRHIYELKSEAITQLSATD